MFRREAVEHVGHHRIAAEKADRTSTLGTAAGIARDAVAKVMAVGEEGVHGESGSRVDVGAGAGGERETVYRNAACRAIGSVTPADT